MDAYRLKCRLSKEKSTKRGSRKMSKLPKLKVNWGSWGKNVEIYDLEQAKDLPLFNSGTLVVVEDQVINSYEELVQLATEERYKNKESLELLVVAAIGGG